MTPDMIFSSKTTITLLFFFCYHHVKINRYKSQCACLPADMVEKSLKIYQVNMCVCVGCVDVCFYTPFRSVFYYIRPYKYRFIRDDGTVGHTVIYIVSHMMMRVCCYFQLLYFFSKEYSNLLRSAIS